MKNLMYPLPRFNSDQFMAHLFNIVTAPSSQYFKSNFRCHVISHKYFGVTNVMLGRRSRIPKNTYSVIPFIEV